MAVPRVLLLGPVVVQLDDAAVDIGGPKPRALLARLALTPGVAVPPAQVLRALWGEEPPPSASATVRSYASRLRGLLGAGVVKRTAGGLLLDVPPMAVDLLAFRDAVSEARERVLDPAEHERTLVQALALWRGPVLTDLASLPLHTDVASRLQEERAEAWEQLLDLRLSRGAAAEVLPDLRQLLVDHPLRERLHGHRMLALYRAGRQAEALSAYSALRQQLADQLGLEPGPAVQQLHVRVLAQDPALLVGRPAARQHRRAVPAPLTGFVGRAELLARVHRLLSTQRLVTLTGTGGVGKTRLALELVRTTSHDRPVVVELAGVRTPQLVLPAVADGFGVALAPGQPVEALAAALCDRTGLVLLDNCEHVAAETSGLARALLLGCPDLRVLVTSRHSLGVHGEVLVDVPPLALDHDDGPGEAVQLFLDRARSATGGEVVYDADETALVAHICARLDGLPLAIELAAARTRLLSIAEIAERLSDRFALLAAPSEDDVRRRTLAQTVGWSFDLLGPHERGLFLALSTFTDGFELDAAEAVAPPGVDVVTTLGELADKSLVRVDLSRAPRRYRLLETLREYAAQHLDRPAAERAGRAHAAFFSELAERSAPLLRAHGGDASWARLTRERSDLRAALTWWSSHDEADRALRLAARLSLFWSRRGHVGEADHLLESTLAAAGPDAPAGDRAQALVALGGMRYLAGDLAPVEALIDEGLSIARARGEMDTAGHALMWLGHLRTLQGLFDEAGEHLQESLQVARDHGIAWLEAETFTVHANLLRERGELDRAAKDLVDAEAMAERCGHRWAAGLATWLAGKTALDLDEPDAAHDALCRGLEHAKGDAAYEAIHLHTLAAAEALRGNPLRGATLLGAVEAAGNAGGFDAARVDSYDAERSLRLVSDRLTATELEMALAAGRRLGLGDAVALAIGGSGPQ